MPGFGIPCPPPSPVDCYATLASNEAQLTEFVTVLMEPISQVVESNTTLLDMVARLLGKRIDYVIRSNDRHLDKVDLHYGSQLAGVIESNAQQLSIVDAARLLSQEPVSEHVSEPVEEPSPIEAPKIESVAFSPTGEQLPPVGEPEPVASRLGQPIRPIADSGFLPPREPAKGVDLGSDFLPPIPPPKLATTFPCPQPPNLVAALGGPIGGPEWCAAVDGILDWLDTLGSKISDWIDTTFDESKWVDTILTLRPPNDQKGLKPDIGRAIIDLLTAAAKVTVRVVRTLKDIIKCAWFYTQILTPIKRPSAYIALLALRNVLAWLSQTRIGSQSYLGFTVGTQFTIPSLSQIVERLLNYLTPHELPSIAEIREAWLKGYITDAHVECLLRLNNANPGLWWTFLKASQEQLTTEESIQFARRHSASVQDQVKLLRTLGWADSQIAEARLELYDELPTINDHLHWLQRNVFDTDYVRDFRLLDGFESKFWPAFGHDLHALGMRKEYAQHHYAAHWVTPAPGQLLEMVYRLRPDKYGRDLSFSLDDYARVLVEQDVAPFFRERFREIAYHVPALSYLRDMYRAGVINDDDMRGYHADLGYSQRDSERFVGIDRLLKARIRTSQMAGWTPAAIANGYAARRLTRDQVAAHMQPFGASEAEVNALIDRADSQLEFRVVTRARSRLLTSTITTVRNSLKVGVIDSEDATQILTGIGWPQEMAANIVTLEVANANTQRVQHAVNHLRSAFHAGEIDSDFVRGSLQQLGIVASAIESYLSAWTIEQTPSRKRRTASQIATDVAEGQLDVDEALARLTNLGYDDADRRLYLADAQRKVITTEAARQAATNLGGRQRELKLAELGKFADGLSKRLMRELKAQAPPSKLQKWIIMGLIDEDYARNRLTIYGYQDSEIELWLAEARAKADEAAKKKAAKQVGK